jgi:probable phosphoglycerate mutase
MARASELVIARYAEAACDVAGIVGGPVGDTGLTTAGRIQAACAGTRLLCEPAAQPYAVVYSGSRPRLLQTGAVISAVLGVPLRRQGTLAAQRYGAAVDARPWRTVVSEFGGVPAREPNRALSEGGESWNAYVARIGRALRRLTARHPGQRIVVIGDNGTVDASFAVFLNLRDASAERVGIDCAPTGLTRWREDPADAHRPEAGLRWSLIEHNAAGHLSASVRALEGVA